MKKLRKLILFLLPLLLLSGCTQYGKLDEGECSGVVAFTNIPKTFTMLDEELQSQVRISVRLRNITTEKEYRVTLNRENEYKQEMKLHPGVYQVVYAVATNSDYTGLTVKATSETMEFVNGQEARLDIVVKDEEAFTNRWIDSQPLPEIRLADKYSGMIQIDRKIISIRDVMPELSFSREKTLNAYQKESFTDTEKGITVTVQNKTGEPLFFTDCEVVGITVTKNNVLFPEGVTVGASTSKICHRQTGLYGEPSHFKGMALFGFGLEDTYAVYQDPATGNRITFTFDNHGDHIDTIQYELGMYE